jgi:hypothetical protein
MKAKGVMSTPIGMKEGLAGEVLPRGNPEKIGMVRDKGF